MKMVRNGILGILFYFIIDFNADFLMIGFDEMGLSGWSYEFLRWGAVGCAAVGFLSMFIGAVSGDQSEGGEG